MSDEQNHSRDANGKCFERRSVQSVIKPTMNSNLLKQRYRQLEIGLVAVPTEPRRPGRCRRRSSANDQQSAQYCQNARQAATTRQQLR